MELGVFGVSRVCYKRAMPAVVYLTTKAPSELAEPLAQAGYTVFEALSVSEVLHLCESLPIDVVLVGSDVRSPGLREIEDRFITLHLHDGATGQDIVWQLSDLLDPRSCMVN